jgi:hypothetical protein
VFLIAFLVMPALVAGIDAFLFRKDVDGRDKPGHDEIEWARRPPQHCPFSRL